MATLKCYSPLRTLHLRNILAARKAGTHFAQALVKSNSSANCGPNIGYDDRKE